MSFFGAIAAAIKGATRDIAAEYKGNPVFLKGVTASCALIAYADGTLEDAEKKKAMEVLTSHSVISTVATRNEIEAALNAALSHAQTGSGKLELARDLDAVKKDPNGANMSQDVYLMAVDVASSNSNHKPGPDESRVLGKIAERLGVDPSIADTF